MKIVSFTDDLTMFVYSTTGWAMYGLQNYLNTEVVVYTHEALRNRAFDGDQSNDVVFIFSVGDPQHCGWSTTQLREKFPNAKFVALCSDSVYYMVNNLPMQMDPDGIDLWLEVAPNCHDFLRNNGAAQVDLWNWTLSEKLLDGAIGYRKAYNGDSDYHEEHKEFDFIGVYNPDSIANPNCWRHHAVKYIEEHGYIFTQGGGNAGHHDQDFNRLFENYLKSRYCLGTTSHNRPELTRLGCCKGFRDDLAPVLDCLLIYDNHPNLALTRNKEGIVPLYDYDDYQSILNCVECVNGQYMELLEKQKIWQVENTIERQLVEKMLKHKIISVKDLK